MPNDAPQDLGNLQQKWLDAVGAAASIDALEQVRVEALGKKGEISGLMKTLGAMAPEARKEFGARINVVKDAVTGAIEAKKAGLADAALDARLARETLDLTLPARPEYEGRIHPISQTIDEIIAIFGEMGFSVAEGPDIEDDFHNFTALNIPADHPARQMQDTFYLPPKEDGSQMVLRTHTSPVQIRTMLKGDLPIRVICPGRTYRVDSDMTHSPMFHQVEGLVIDTETNMSHLKGCLQDFVRAFFGIDDLPVRFRPSYFPFTEPSAEVDIGCDRSGGELKLGKGKDWLEILGSGMVHPNVLKNCGIDPSKYQGFAFGMGIERIAMLKYGIPDLRTFYESDLRWLRHYGFVPLDIPTAVGGLTR
ncbi:phenylalanyl-tRNA synthetase alpha subunit [Dongia mobilis]|uniref:Phenylalanine--tRNA ligase alpha subunit n=1 Tax=Dongia mobilis TaxID=578943 RepID=A0A4R6WQA5_9PROT|nr:phenylalanine--tRNA ligase subunit alpha [Dongia mobilis]TDQ78558.1 phenylalanyl-tRNA synthetase alpha subunit [Dongia mobilis]